MCGIFVPNNGLESFVNDHNLLLSVLTYPMLIPGTDVVHLL